MTEYVTDLASRRTDGAPVAIPFDAPGHTVNYTEAEHVLRGMFALEPDYFAALLMEVTLGRPLNLSAIAKARKTLVANPTADAG